MNTQKSANLIATMSKSTTEAILNERKDSEEKMKDYKLNFNQKNRTIQFLRKAGKDVFMGQMKVNNAMWMIRNGRATNNPIPHHEDFPICVDNEFWFPGEWKTEDEQKDFSTEEISTEESSLGF